MSAVRFGVFLSPSASGLDELERQVATAEESGFDYVSIQDHPYVTDVIDTLALITHLAAGTSRIHFMTNVANLPLRPAPMLARAAASMDLLSHGRFELGLGGGHAWDQITALGGPRWTPAQTVDAVDDAIDATRGTWPGGRILLGAGGPRMLDLLGRKADGWIVPMRTDRAHRLAGQERIDRAARAAGRDPREVERIVQVVGDPDPATVADVLSTERFDAVNWIAPAASPDAISAYADRVITRLREATA